MSAPTLARGAKGHRGLPISLGCRAVLPALECSAGKSPPGETEAQWQVGSGSLCRAPHPPGEGNASPRCGQDDTSSLASSRSTLFLQEPRSPGCGQAASASLLPAPPPARPARPARLCPRHPHPAPRHTPSRRVSGRPWSRAAAAPHHTPSTR